MRVAAVGGEDGDLREFENVENVGAGELVGQGDPDAVDLPERSIRLEGGQGNAQAPDLLLPVGGD